MSVEAKLPNLVSQFAQVIETLGAITPQSKIGIAVSGGGDSIAMMHMAAQSLDPQRLHIVSVDHGLRPEAKDEIGVVTQQANALGLPHTILNWVWDQSGNLQAAARDGRFALMREWAVQNGIETLLLGHTEDDQVETFLLRLARGSGVDGLTGMAHADIREGLPVARPLLGMSRDSLRDWLCDEGIEWCDDPSNEDTRFDRVRARQMYAQLETLGLTRKRLLQTVDHMQAAHLSLQRAAHDFAHKHVRQDAGDLIFAPQALDLELEDTPRRVMAAAFSWVASQPYRPRFENLLARVDQVRKGHKVTLAGCILLPLPDGGARLLREASATCGSVIVADALVHWDNRWQLTGPIGEALEIKALGEGIAQCENWRETGFPRASLMASPSVWQGDRLIAAPIAGFSNGWTAQIVADFHSRAFGIED